VISYKDDLPVGKVRDYYKSGLLQMESRADASK
jgi:antitoxin component YwqK of YwqJK toxin-antitoxin module